MVSQPLRFFCYQEPLIAKDYAKDYLMYGIKSEDLEKDLKGNVPVCLIWEGQNLGPLKLHSSVWFVHMRFSRERVQGLHELPKVSGLLQNVNHWFNPFFPSSQGALEIRWNEAGMESGRE